MVLKKVIIEEYNACWPREFAIIKSSLEVILQDVSYVSIEHVGSTSIPGLAAKPIIDIDIIICLSSLQAARTAMVRAGYTDCGEMDVPGRYAFRQPGFAKHQGAFGEKLADGRCRWNTYAMVEGCVALRNHLDVKRILLQDVELRHEYAALKWSLNGLELEGIGPYAAAKKGVLEKIRRKAGWTDEELGVVRATTEDTKDYHADSRSSQP